MLEAARAHGKLIFAFHEKNKGLHGAARIVLDTPNYAGDGRLPSESKVLEKRAIQQADLNVLEALARTKLGLVTKAKLRLGLDGAVYKGLMEVAQYLEGAKALPRILEFQSGAAVASVGGFIYRMRGVTNAAERHERKIGGDEFGRLVYDGRSLFPAMYSDLVVPPLWEPASYRDNWQYPTAGRKMTVRVNAPGLPGYHVVIEAPSSTAEARSIIEGELIETIEGPLKST